MLPWVCSMSPKFKRSLLLGLFGETRTLLWSLYQSVRFICPLSAQAYFSTPEVSPASSTHSLVSPGGLPSLLSRAARRISSPQMSPKSALRASLLPWSTDLDMSLQSMSSTHSNPNSPLPQGPSDEFSDLANAERSPVSDNTTASPFTPVTFTTDTRTHTAQLASPGTKTTQMSSSGPLGADATTEGKISSLQDLPNLAGKFHVPFKKKSPVQVHVFLCDHDSFQAPHPVRHI